MIALSVRVLAVSVVLGLAIACGAESKAMISFDPTSASRAVLIEVMNVLGPFGGPRLARTLARLSY